MLIFVYCCFQTNPEIVKRWSNEVQEGIQSRSALVQFHALALLHQVSLLHYYHRSRLVYVSTLCLIKQPLRRSISENERCYYVYWTRFINNKFSVAAS